MSANLERRMARNEEDMEAIGGTVLSIRDTVERHSGQLCKIRRNIVDLSDKVTGVKEEVLDVKITQGQHTKVLDEHGKALAELRGDVTELRGDVTELRGGVAEILRRLPAEN